MAEQLKNQIWEKLTEKDHLLLTALCEIPQFSNASLANSLIELLDEKNQAQDFIIHLLRRRIRSAAITESKDFTNVLRDNLLVVLAVVAYSNGPEGTAFLKSISLPFKEVLPLLDALEMNPANLPEGEDLGKRAENVGKAVDIVLECAYSSAPSFPPFFAKICKLLRAESEQRLKALEFSDDQSKEGALRLVGAYFFLRLFIPLVTNPASYSSADMTKEQRKGTIFLAKVLSSLVSQQQFGLKDEHLTSLNDSLSPHRPRILAFLDDISKPDFEGGAGSETTGKGEKHFSNVDQVISYIIKSLPKLDDLPDESVKASTQELKALVEKLQSHTEEPPAKKLKDAEAEKEKEREREREKEAPKEKEGTQEKKAEGLASSSPSSSPPSSSLSIPIVLSVIVAVAAAAFYFFKTSAKAQ